MALEPQQPGLGGDAAGETDQRTALADHPVAGHENGQGIVAGRLADRAEGGGFAHGAGDLAVGAQFAVGNLQQLGPDLDLEIGAQQVQVDGEVGAAADEILGQLAVQFGEVLGIFLDRGFSGEEIRGRWRGRGCGIPRPWAGIPGGPGPPGPATASMGSSTVLSKAYRTIGLPPS